MSDSKSLRELFIRFAQNTRHRHNFVVGSCEFCHLPSEKCQHDDSNVELIQVDCKPTIKCTCSYFGKCNHPKEHVSECGDDGRWYDYCARCKSHI